MGFMDRMKGAAKQMGDAAKEGVDPRNIAVAGDANRIGQEGVETKAILRGITATSGKKLGGGTEYTMELEVHPAAGEPYSATVVQQLIEASADHYVNNVGGEVKVKVDPQDPQKMLLWG